MPEVTLQSVLGEIRYEVARDQEEVGWVGYTRQIDLMAS